MSSRLRVKKDGFGVRLRFGEGLLRDEWFHVDMPHGEPATEAELGAARDRLKRLQAIAKKLAAAGEYGREVLEEAARTPHPRGFMAIERKVESLTPATTEHAPVMTFRRVADMIWSGQAHQLYPDHIRYKSAESLAHSAVRLGVFLPLLGDKTFDEITRKDINAAKLLIPKSVAGTTRSYYIGELARIMSFAVDPLELTDKVLLIKVPRPSSAAVFTFLYPTEDAQILLCKDIPFEIRFLFGFVCRNGGRITETLQYRWADIDLENGTICVPAEITKSKRARYWDLEPDVLEALRLRRKQIPDEEFVFIGPTSDRTGRRRAMTRKSIWHWLEVVLRLAGVTRKQARETKGGLRKLRVHDLRATFITLARAMGKSDRWIMDRSGHETIGEFQKYDRGVRHAKERNLGWLSPMHEALGMVDPDRRQAPSDPVSGSGQARAKTPNLPIKELEMSVASQPPEGPPSPINPANSGGQPGSKAPEGPFGPAGFPISGQSWPLSPEQLSELLDLARTARRWHLVAPLGEALEQAERVREAAQPKVTDIAKARRRKEEQ